VALILGLMATAVLGWMVIGPFFENAEDYVFTPRLDYAFLFTPCVFVLALASFLLADGGDATEAAPGVAPLAFFAVIASIATSRLAQPSGRRMAERCRMAPGGVETPHTD
jgi:hypothetical protein